MKNTSITSFIPVEIPDEARPGHTRLLTPVEIEEINDWYRMAQFMA